MARNINGLQPDGHGWRARLGVPTRDDSAIAEPPGHHCESGSLRYALRVAGAEARVDDYGQLWANLLP